MKLISVIIPVYNVEKYLEECVKSLINQSYKNLEIILVNDGSTDSSGVLCDNLALLDSRISVIHKNNEGLGFARNTGLEYANGEYVTFIDSDDYADKNLIELLYEGIVNYNADTCIGGFKRVNDLNQVIYEEKYDMKNYSGREVKDNLLVRMLGSSPTKSDAIRMSVWNVLFSTNIIKRNKLTFLSERDFISEDILFDLEYYKYSKKVTVIDSTAYNYRINNMSLTMKYKEDMLGKCTKLYKEIYSKIDKDYKDSKNALIRLKRQYFVNVRSCIKQENIRISKKNINIAIKNIRNICSNEDLQSIIRSYPVKLLGIKQKMFLFMVEKKMAITLYILTLI